MNLEQELNKLNIQIRFSLKNNYNNEYYIIINKNNMSSKYIVSTLDIELKISIIAFYIINNSFSEVVKSKFNLTRTNNTIISTFNPKLLSPTKTYLIPKHTYFPKDRDELYRLVRKLIYIRGNKCSLNDIDTSNITNMSYLFKHSNFKGDISNWDTSNVVDMDWMFYKSKFNGDISNWDVGNVVDMEDMFGNSPLECKEPKWYIY